MTEMFLLSEAQMGRISTFFPLSHGVPRVDDRRVIGGIIFVIRNGLSVNGRVKVSQWATQNVATLGSARLLHKRAPASGRPRLSQSWRLPGCFGP